MKFRKKPVVIDAVRWTGQNPDAVNSLATVYGTLRPQPDGSLEIATLEGTMRAEPGDWIIRGVKGECYPCKPDIFEATYDPA